MGDDLRAVIADDYRTVIARVGPQAGSIAHLLHEGAEATLCGVPRAILAPYEDLDEPICSRCIEWLSKQPNSGRKDVRKVLS
jgi:hypothetical protein